MSALLIPHGLCHSVPGYFHAGIPSRPTQALTPCSEPLFSSSAGPSPVSCHVSLVSVTEEKFLSLSLSFTAWAFLWIEVNYFIEWSSVLMKLLINFYLLVTFLLPLVIFCAD